MTNFPENITRVAYCGDWHRDYNYARKALNYCIEQGAEFILHVGDLGISARENDGYLSMINETCERRGVVFAFVDGNHEHHPWLNAQPIDQDGVRRLRSHLWHLPRGFRWEWTGVKFMALGGAHSVDRQWLTEHIDWFREEAISIKDAYEATNGGTVDVMITHDCPSGVMIPGLDEGATIFPPEEIETAERHRSLLREVVDVVKPRYLWHGHYHRRYQYDLLLSGGEHCLVTGLDMNEKPFDKNIHVVDVYQLAEWWID